ncbi:PREDICTED: heavy metal-associated isoprenylated plant protein 20 [Tarenaya hassleriana]|uniref:heavy metal-associated isoprenylated plant protein 20 n=1 Tax=Tarenaya hassleriana TaxID=28532 RepID=UPI00053C8635|nr:PREDICTED: heavy metal-associated isoprenylated plant protein 20 [Tarenaya hassleriana]
MGFGGTMEYLSELINGGRHKHGKKKKKQFQTVELKVRMDCDGCVLKVKNALSSLSGVKTVEINRKQHKVTVTGYVDASKVLKKAKGTGKKAEIWPYVPYNLVARPYVAGAYDKKAPPGYVRRVDPPVSTGTMTIHHDDDPSYVSLFSDDNPNACSIM